ncbi:MAG: TonB-dependent receptor domain-containing protein, partial [Gammaproteobacteria bacterium]
SVFLRNGRIFSLTPGGLLLAGTGATTIADGRPRGFGAGNTLLHFDQSGNLVSYNPGIPFGVQNASGGNGFNLQETSQLTSDVERIVGTLQANYEIFDNITAFFEGNYYRAEAHEIIDQPIFNATLFGGTSAAMTFQVTDPRLSAASRAQLQALGVTSFRLSRASRDLVTNNASGKTEVVRGVAGIGGDFEMMSRTFTFEASANYGESRSSFFSNVLDQQKFVNAINVTTNAQGQIVCNTNVTAATNVAPGGILPIADPNCVPLDVFGEGRASAAAKAYVTGQAEAVAVLEQQVYNINFGTSELHDLWAGPIGFNVGYEHRVESASFSPNAFQRAGRGRSVPIGANKGSFNTDEVFGEIVVPLVSPDNNIPLVHSLDLEGKIRYVNNTVNGGFTAYTYGGRYTPVPGVQFRGNYTRSLRAPAVTELFTPQQPAFDFFNDPCDSINQASGTNPALRQKNCAAFFADYGINGATFLSQARVASIPIVSGGNPDLGNEKGSSYTFGVVLQPRFLPRFRLAVDWNRIKITGNIVSLTSANIAEGCYDNPDFDAANVDDANQFCSLFDRVRGGPNNGQLVSDAANPGLRRVFVNGAYIDFRGLTTEAEYNFPLDALGMSGAQIDLSGTLFYLDRLTTSNNGVTTNPLAGQLGNPRYSGQFNIGLSTGPFGLDFQTNYQSKQNFNNLNTV